MVGEFLKKRNIDDIWAGFDPDVSDPQRLMFGVKEIDQALKGGLLLGKLSEIYGPSGSGKTQFALSLTSEVFEYKLILLLLFSKMCITFHS
uniref:Rad51/recA bacterial DNA recombination protein/KaiC, putative n=1 Tax=Theileria annulata TaxID=5874 RepID=A0A3B0NIC7_THEAN